MFFHFLFFFFYIFQYLNLMGFMSFSFFLKKLVPWNVEMVTVMGFLN